MTTAFSLTILVIDTHNREPLDCKVIPTTKNRSLIEEKALEAFVTATTKALKKGDRVALVGFGSFSVSKRAARVGRNPQTGKEIQIKASKRVKFSAGKALKDAVRG